MKLTHLALPLIAALALTTLTLGGCSRQDAADKTAAQTAAPAAADTAATPAQPYEMVAAQGKGFSVGAMMSANTVYVLFDPQCPHCGRLWQASVPLHGKARFVWIPISFGNPKSAPQGATLLAAANPAELMEAHEKSLLAGTGGIAASASVTADLEQAIKQNTDLLNRLGGDSVPYVIAKNQRTGKVVTNVGAMETPALAEFLGISQP